MSFSYAPNLEEEEERDYTRPRMRATHQLQGMMTLQPTLQPR